MADSELVYIIESLKRVSSSLQNSTKVINRRAPKPPASKPDKDDSDIEVQVEDAVVSTQFSGVLAEANSLLDRIRNYLDKNALIFEDSASFDDIVRTLFRLAMHRDAKIRLKVADIGIRVRH